MSFETAYKRLEEILEKMNSGTVSLDDSLALYEEADILIRTCNQTLTQAEQRIEVLVKNRQGELLLGEDGRPVTQDFNKNRLI